MNNNEENKNVNVNEQNAQVENNEKKSWFGTAIGAVKNTAGAATSFVKEHKTMTAVGAGVITVVGTIALVVLKKKGKAGEPAVDAEGFDNK
jgi:hypothetical protein